MQQSTVPAHWIRPNESTRLPRRHIVIDTEARQTEQVGGRTQTFRLACAAFDHQRKAGSPWAATERGDFTTPQALWEWVDARTQEGRRTIVVAHNLAYDLRVGAAFDVLPAMGWTLDHVHLDGRSSWAQWHRGKRSLSMVDTVSWFGCSLDKLGQHMGVTKLRLPGWNEPDEAWLARCRVDVEILRDAWRRVLDWIERDDLGNWKPTGAGQGWAFFRHKHMTHKILHHGVEKVAAVEREAGWAGRCEAWMHGRLPKGVWTEWDFTGAYARVARDHDVPVRLRTHLGPRAAQKALDGAEGVAAVLRCRITTATPVAPTRGPHGILWPTGTFESWLWDVEAREARANGATVECVEGWSYTAEPALRSWATWVLDVAESAPADFDPVCRLVVKGWSRTTVGRFGSRWASWDDVGESHGEPVVVRVQEDGDTGTRRRQMMVGGRCFTEGDQRDAPDGAVHVMSFVMAQCRVNLWRTMLAAGLENVAYVDTDSVLVNRVGSEALAVAAIDGLRVKSRWRSVKVLGPRQLVLKGGLRAAGVPTTAVQVGPDRWSAEIWRSLAASLRQGEADRVVIRDRTYRLRGVDHRRSHVGDGSTVAVDLAL